MDLTLNQIQALRKEGLSDEDIAEQLGLEAALVAAVSRGGELDIRVAPEVAREMLEGIVELARDAQSEDVRYRARRFIVDDFKGRLDQKAPTTVNVNIVEMNQGIKRARAAILGKAFAAQDVSGARQREVAEAQLVESTDDAEHNL